jgi:hypothetical protein
MLFVPQWTLDQVELADKLERDAGVVTVRRCARLAGCLKAPPGMSLVAAGAGILGADVAHHANLGGLEVQLLMGSSLNVTAFDAVNLAESASNFFCGYFPVTPYFPDEFILLPWHDEYHTTKVDGTIMRRGSIATAVARVAAQLDRAHPSAGFEEWSITYHSAALAASNRTILQGLAVETMLLADGCIKRLVQANLLGAVPCLTAAYRRIMDCTRQAQDIIELANGSGDHGSEQAITPVRHPRRLEHGRSNRSICAEGRAIPRALQCVPVSAGASKARRRHRRR